MGRLTEGPTKRGVKSRSTRLKRMVHLFLYTGDTGTILPYLANKKTVGATKGDKFNISSSMHVLTT